jgi:CubicO group peptidase (beta-lactamase class C family)
MRTTSFVLAAAAAWLPTAARLPAQAAGCHDLQAIAAVQQDLLAAFPLAGDSCVRIDQGAATVHQAAAGRYTLAEVVPIASATKTLSAAVLLALVDDGVLALDDRIGQYLPEWNTGSKASITLRMCFTHTSGMAVSDPLVGDDTVTLRTAAQRLALRPLVAAPGTEFAYGGVSMHVAGAVCEVASGRTWTQLFQQELAGPLQFTATDYEAFGPTPNPRIAGGARSNVGDFAAFVGMLRAGGVWQGATVLSPQAVAVMLQDQTSHLPSRNTPHPESAPYGLGIWLDRVDALGAAWTASAAGAFGFVGWIDRAHDVAGVFLVENRYPEVHPYVRRVWAAVDDALLPAGTTCVGAPSPACGTAAWLNASRAPRGGDPGFALHASRAPAGAFGGLLLGAPLVQPVPLFDLQVWLVLPAPVFTTWQADADGRALLPASLASLPVGTTLGVQAFWLDPNGCGAAGLRASHALRLDVLP